MQRDRGEALSIRQMVEQMASDTAVDRSRVFITGLSAGGAMTSVMLACYPEVFAAGAIIAGLPYGAATNVQQAFESMFQSPARAAPEWGDLVRGAAPHNGPWPRISVWHGGADQTVIPANARQIVKQWTDVHGLPTTPLREATVDGYPRQVWLNDAGDEVIESYTITHMAHGTPLAKGAADDACGAAGPFLLEVGISSSYHIAKFFGLTGTRLRPVAPRISENVTLVPGRPYIGTLTATRAQPEALQDKVLHGEILGKKVDAQPDDTRFPPPLRTDVGAVIAKALTAAGDSSRARAGGSAAQDSVERSETHRSRRPQDGAKRSLPHREAAPPYADTATAAIVDSSSLPARWSPLPAGLGHGLHASRNQRLACVTQKQLGTRDAAAGIDAIAVGVARRGRRTHERTRIAFVVQDDGEIEHWKKFVGLEGEDIPRILALKQVVTPRVEDYTEAFFQHLATVAPFPPLLAGARRWKKQND